MKPRKGYEDISNRNKPLIEFTLDNKFDTEQAAKILTINYEVIMENQCTACENSERKPDNEKAKDNECYKYRGVAKSFKLRSKFNILVECQNFSYIQSIKFS